MNFLTALLAGLLPALARNKYVKWAAAALVAVVVSAVAAYLHLPIPPLPVPPLPEAAPMPAPPGWDREAADSNAGVKAVQDALPIQRFQDTPAFEATQDVGDVFLWDACRKATGDLLPPRDQKQVGSCVSFGTNSAIEHLMCVQIATGGKNEEFKAIAQEVTYGGSRVQVGGGRIRGDGSVGAWAAKFVQQWGVVARGKYGKYDLTNYSESTCRQFGSSGCPAELLDVAKQNPVKGITQVMSADEAKKALANGYPIAVCSSQGFNNTRDKDGFCNAQGSWAHCMAVVGYCQSGGRKGFFILNSWGGDYCKGPVGLGNPSPAGFYADENVADKMFRAGDSWAFSDIKGFPGRKIDWFLGIKPAAAKRPRGIDPFASTFARRAS